MVRRVKIGGDSTTTTSGVSEEKALAEVEVSDQSAGGVGFMLNFFADDAERELTQKGALEAFHSSPPLHMAVSAISRAVGEVEYGWEDDNEPPEFSLESPNRWHQSAEFFGLLAAYLELTGELPALKNDTARGVELWPFPPHIVDKPDVRSDRWRVENGAVLGLSRDSFERDELIVLQKPSLLDPYMHGRGPGQVVGHDVDVDEAASEHTAAYLENHARPDAVMSFEDINRKDKKRLQESMQSSHGGPANSGKLEALEAGSLSVETLQSSFDDLGLEELRRYSAEVVRHVFGIPPSVIGDVSDTNRATAETEDFLFKKNLIKPLVDKIVEGVNQQFVKPDLGEQYAITTGEIVPEDRRFKSELMVQVPQAFTVDEARELAGEDRFDDERGEQTLTEAAPAAPSGAPQQRSGAPDQPKGCGHDHSPQKKITPIHTKQVDDERIEQVLEAVEVEDLEGVRDEFERAMEEWAEQTVEGIDGESFADVFGGGVLDEAVEAAVEERMEWVLPDIADHTRDRLHQTILEGLDEGVNPREVAGQIEEQYDEFDKVRSERIARTEMLSASNAGTFTAHSESDVVKMRSWLSTRDGNVRPAHVTLDERTSQNPIGVDEPFEIAGDSARYPGDFSQARLSVNCRCTTVAEFPDRNRSDAERQKLWERYVKGLQDDEQRTAEVVRGAFEQQRQKVLSAFADAFDVELEAAA